MRLALWKMQILSSAKDDRPDERMKIQIKLVQVQRTLKRKNPNDALGRTMTLALNSSFQVLEERQVAWTEVAKA